MQNNVAIVIGDSTHNTLSAVRSLGEAGICQYLILKCDADVCFVAKSKYLNSENIFHIHNISECLNALTQIKESSPANVLPYIICTFDEAATFIDDNEPSLCKNFITPCRGNQIGNLFNKENQCRLAKDVGLLTPKTISFDRDTDYKIPDNFNYPLILKPLLSTDGEKSDIHICYNPDEIKKALETDSQCSKFVLQEFIEKECELDCIGVSTDDEVFIAGAVKKIRHYPPKIGAGAYGLFLPFYLLDIDIKAIYQFIRTSGYYGPFSIEFVHNDNQNYFMEVNFRNEGLAYAATAAGSNLHAMYLGVPQNLVKIRPTYIMNYSLDYLYVKEGNLSFFKWLRDFLRTRGFININFKDLNPIISYYTSKFKRISKRFLSK